MSVVWTTQSGIVSSCGASESFNYIQLQPYPKQTHLPIMSTTTRITIDDEGDTLIILKLRSDDSNPDVTDIIATADESTIETTTETTATSNVTTDDAVQSEDRPHTEEHFLCSKKHLSFASRRASKMFSSNFKEASKEEDGLHQWTFEALFQPTAFEIVLNFIHGKTRDVL